MHSVDVSAECTTSVNLPQDSHSRNSIGTMQLSILPRDQASDTLNNSNLNLSRVSPFDINENIQENLPLDDNIPNHPFNSSSRGTPLPRDALSPNIPNLSSSNVIQPRDEDSNASHQPDSFQPILIQSGSSQPNLNIANSNQVYFKQANDSNLASNIHHASTGDIPCSKIKEISHSSKTESPQTEALPTHLKLLPPAIPIPEGYKWIFIHGGCTLVPSINSDKFYSQEPSPPTTLLEVPFDEELVDQGDDDDCPIDEIAEDDQFLIEECLSHLEANRPPENLISVHTSDIVTLPLNSKSILAETGTEKISTDFPLDLQPPDSSLQPKAQKQIRRSDRPRKLSGRWTEEAGFITHPPRSTKKKAPKDPRDGNSTSIINVFSSWSYVQFFNYSNACGVKFLGSQNHKNKMLRQDSFIRI